ncbi:MAG: FG-GAP repeat protein [Gammaproteobacteria bacterium]
MFQRRCVPIFPRLLFALLGLIAFPSAYGKVTNADAAAREGRATLPIESQASISAVLGRDEEIYHARADGEVLRLDNPRHALTALFSAEGIEVQSGGARLRLHFRGAGRGARREAIIPTQPEASVNRVEYRREGLTEWYVNGPLGLEQGFILSEPPGRITGEALMLALHVGGELRPEPVVEGMDLVRGDGTAVLRYRGLAAWDATGRKLPVWWQCVGREVRLRVDDTEARYPVTIDPLIEQAKLTASDGAGNDFFGFSVAVDGDTVVVGSHLKDIDGRSGAGAAYVFVRPAGGFAGPLQENARLTASDAARTLFFGASVAVSADTIVVGNLESAYVFVKPPGGWAGQLTQEDAKLIPSNGGTSFAFFDEGVAVSGDTVVVGGAFNDVGGNSNQGSAFVFVKPPAGWAGTLRENAVLTASDGAADDRFGFSVAVSHDTIVIGAPTGTVGDSNQGAAYVFVEPTGGWLGQLMENAKLITTDASTTFFGFSVDVSGDTVVAGFPAAVFVRPAGGWAGVLAESAKLNLGNFRVAISGDVVASGIPLQVYRRPSGGWAGTVTAGATFTASDSGVTGGLGLSLALSGNTLVAGAPGDAIGGNTSQGSAYVFDASASEAEPAAMQIGCKTTGCKKVPVTCNLPPAQGIRCDIRVRIRLLVAANAARLSDGAPVKAKRPITFAAGAANVPPGRTGNVRLKLTKKGEEIVSKTRKKKLRAVIEIRNAIGTALSIGPIAIKLR